MAQHYSLPTLYNQSLDGFIVIAHRGASAYYPENTIPAFEAAVEMGAEMIELDVQLSGDAIPVVFHDHRLKRHTDGKGKLKNYTLSELKKLDAGSWLSSEFAGTKIPTLEEALAFACGKIALNIEIKTDTDTEKIIGGMEEKCLQLVKKHNMEEHVLFSSFDYRAISHLKELNPEMPVALLYDRAQSGKKLPSELIKASRADAFNYSYRQRNEKWTRDLKTKGIPNFIYTVNNESHMQGLLEAGVSGIFTDKPDLLISVIQRQQTGTKR